MSSDYAKEYLFICLSFNPIKVQMSLDFQTERVKVTQFNLFVEMDKKESYPIERVKYKHEDEVR